jgi:hypothetical protein
MPEKQSQIKLSATSLEGYIKCPQYYQHRWIDRWKEPVFESSAFGVVLHDAAARTLMLQDIPTWEKMYEDAGYPDVSHDLIQLTDDYYGNWRSHINLLDLPIEVEVKKEKPYDEQFVLVGKIDAIYQTESGLKIVDHKFLKNASKVKGNLQMAMYSLLVPEANEFVYEKVGLEDYNLQVVHSLKSSLLKISEVIQYIRDGKFDVHPQQWYIQFCPFLKECGKCLKGV